MVAEGRKEGLCDLSNAVALGHNELWLPKAVKVATMLVKISANGNIVPARIGRQGQWSSRIVAHPN